MRHHRDRVAIALKMLGPSLKDLRVNDQVVRELMSGQKWHYTIEVIARVTSRRIILMSCPETQFDNITGSAVGWGGIIHLPTEMMLLKVKTYNEYVLARKQRESQQDAIDLQELKWVGSGQWADVFKDDLDALHELANRVRAWRGEE